MSEFSLSVHLVYAETGVIVIRCDKPDQLQIELKDLSQGLKFLGFLRRIKEFSDFKLRELAKEVDRIERMKEEKWG